MDASLIQMVRQRAANHREYCHLPELSSCIPFEIDHVVARKHGGTTAQDNLALSCFYCNSRKGPNIGGIDPESNVISRLFHPRQDRWNEHFRWKGPILIGLTPIGRATVQVLDINAPDFVLLRASLIREEIFPDIANDSA